MRFQGRIQEMTINDSLATQAETFPLPYGHPIIVYKGEVLTRIGDSHLELSPFAGEQSRVNLRSYRSTEGGVHYLSDENFSINTLIASFLIFHPRESYKSSTISYKIGLLAPIFKICEENKIKITDLYRYPRLVETIVQLPHAKIIELLTLLHELLHTSEIGHLKIISNDQINAIRKKLKKHTKRQTPYIPDRILNYQQTRIERITNDYLDNQEAFEKLFEYCVKQFQINHGERFPSKQLGDKAQHSPFSKTSASAFGMVYAGNFAEVAEHFGVAHIIKYWTLAHDIHLEDDVFNAAKKFSKFLNGVVYGGAIYIASVTAMRRGEIAKLKVGCHQIVTLPDLGVQDIIEGECASIIKGITTKTVQDTNALWISNKFSAKVVEAMTSITKLRIGAAEIYSDFKVDPEYKKSPNLVERAYEPWYLRKKQLRHPHVVRPTINYKTAPESCVNLFESDEMQINASDYNIACALTPTLNKTRFSIGAAWPAHMHQYRRTLIANASASGLVSDQSAQYQAKHNLINMTRYYGSNHHQLNRDPTLRQEIMEAMQWNLVRSVQDLEGDEHISRFGENHKQRLISYLSSSDEKKLKKMAEQHQIFFRRNIFGACMSRVTCNRGGVTMLSYCNNCSELLISKKNKGLMVQALEHLKSVRSSCEPMSLLSISVGEQIEAIQENLGIIGSIQLPTNDIEE